MARKRFVFENMGEADAFEYGLEYANDSAITVVKHGYDPKGGVFIIVEDIGLDEDEGFDDANT